MKSMLWAMLFILVISALAAGGTYGIILWKDRSANQEINLAESYLAQGKATEAEQILAKRLEGRPKASWVPRALALRFQVLTQLKDQAEAQKLADRALDLRKPLVKPGQEAWARAHLVLAQSALEAKQPKIARSHIDAILSQPDGTWGKDEATLGLARLEMADGQIAKAQERLTALLEQLPENSTARPGVEKALGLCNSYLLFSPQPFGKDEIYVLQKGDTLDRLKRKFRIAPDILMSINKIPDPRRLSIGRRIKVPRLELSIVVDKGNNTLTVYNYGKFFKKYPVRTGAEDFMTPTGDFKVVNKVKDPPWHNPKDNMNYAPGDPNNELGSRWLGFQGMSLGIHEARDPNTIGKYSSNGCVGMLKQDVEELYDLVPMGTPVKIVGQKTATSS